MLDPVGIIGLGRIGLCAATAFIEAGYTVFGYDISQTALDQFVSAGGISVQNPEEITRHVEVVIILALNDEQVIEIIDGKNGILRSSNSALTVICMSTINRSTLETLAGKCEQSNIGFVDCPFTGGPARIKSRSLTLIAAAPTPTIQRVTQVLEVLGKITYAGSEPGLGQAIKHCNQLLVGATHAATMEVISLSRRLGLDPVLVTSVISSGIAGSDYFRLLSESVLLKSPSPGGLGQMAKDMSIVVKTLDKAGMHGYVATAAWTYFSEASRLGMEDREGADLIDVVEKMSVKK